MTSGRRDPEEAEDREAEAATKRAAHRELDAGGIVVIAPRSCSGGSVEEERQNYCGLYLYSHKRGTDDVRMYARILHAEADELLRKGGERAIDLR